MGGGNGISAAPGTITFIVMAAQRSTIPMIAALVLTYWLRLQRIHHNLSHLNVCRAIYRLNGRYLVSKCTPIAIIDQWQSNLPALSMQEMAGLNLS